MLHTSTTKYNKQVEISEINPVHILNVLKKEMMGDGDLSQSEISELWKVVIQKVQKSEIVMSRIAREAELEKTLAKIATF